MERRACYSVAPNFLIALLPYLGVSLTDSYPLKGAGRPVRVEDVAREAGVSPITVSRALRTPEKVKPETLERVLEAVRRTHYQVNAIASSLRSGQSTFVSVFVANLQNQHFAAAMQGAIDAFEGSRFHLMFAQTGYADDLSAERFKALLPFRPAAIMLTGAVRDAGTREFLADLGVPVMEMWGEQPDPVDMLASSGGREGGYLMGRHLGEQGYRRIAYVGQANHGSAWRIDGFIEGLKPFGIEPALILPMEGMQQIEDGVAAFDRVLAELPDCDAIFFGSDVTAAGAVIRALERGMPIPERIAIAGYGDLYFAAHIQPRLTSVHVFDYEVGRQAGQMLLRRLNGESIAQPVIQVPVRLEIRGSTTRL